MGLSASWSASFPKEGRYSILIVVGKPKTTKTILTLSAYTIQGGLQQPSILEAGPNYPYNGWQKWVADECNTWDRLQT